MIARWMVGALAFSLLCAVAAWSAERALSAWRRPIRWPWVVSMFVATLWPLLAPLLLARDVDTMRGGITMGPLTAMGTIEPVAPTGFALLMERANAWASAHDNTLLVLWSVATTLLLMQVVLALRTLSRVKQRAREELLDGELVLVDDTVGPAVIGLVTPRIVLPTWLLSLDAPLRGLVLRHEREHCRAGDARLVWLAVAATTLLPWNAALWWMVHRLRLAMEIDCDARTAESPDERTRYAKLLLLIAQHKQSARFAPMLSVSSSQLSRRIRAMHATTVRYPALRAAAAGFVMIAAGVTACSPRIATNLTSPGPVNAPAPAAMPTATVATAAAPAADTVGSKPFFEFQVDQPAALRSGEKGPAYPPAQRAAGIVGNVLVQFVVNTDGAVEVNTIKVLRSTQDAFTDAVRTALAGMRFTPATKDGQPVRQLVQQPFQFGVSEMPDPIGGVAAGPTTLNARISVSAAVPVESSTPRSEFQTEQPAVLRPGNMGPVYPPALSAAKIEGTVSAQFVLGADGRVELNSFKVLRSTHPEFTDAVRNALARMEFEPARADGRAVKQLMQQTFQFALGK